jgi:hypothetical protein
LTVEARELDSFYVEHDALGQRLYDEYTTEQLQLLLGFVRQGREFNERRAAEVEHENQDRENQAGAHQAGAHQAGEARRARPSGRDS